jgi:hypothetical protein
MYPVGLHGDLIRGISLGIHFVIEIVVTKSAVAVYYLHDTFLIMIWSFMELKEDI